MVTSSKNSKASSLALFLLSTITLSSALPISSTVSEVTSFSLEKSPSGLYFDEDGSSLLYVLCGTQTNQDHYIYAYTVDGVEQCLITIPQAVGMSRVDGFFITQDDSKAYIVDSQGPIYAEESDQYLGGSLYEVEWTDPCGCSSGTCSSSSVEWSPTVTNTWTLSAADVSDEEGGGVDEYFRNSGVVVVGDTFYAVNGVHPVDGTLTSEYLKSIVQVDMTSSSIINTWSYDGDTVGHDVDMEGLTCGPDQCETYLYVGDEYNYIYQLELSSGEVTREWDLNSIVGNVPADKGIEALTYASSTGYFYAGIQETAEIHVVALESVDSGSTPSPTESGTSGESTSSQTTLSECTATDDYPECSAPTIPLSEKRIRREVRSLSTEQWDKVVSAMWVMKTTSMTEGKALYGDSFRNYDYFVLKHVVATTDSRGDQAHFGAHFMTWHLAFIVEFENSLLAVDPEIEGAPYWDECISEPSVFSDDYFGTDPSGDSYQITDGKFAYWPVETNFSMNDWTDYIVDFSTVTYYGGGATSTYLRSTDNGETSEYAVRYGSGTGWESSISSTSIDDWWECTADSVTEWNNWYACVEAGNPSFHSGPHAQIGGRASTGGGRPGRKARSLQDTTLTARGDFEDPATSPNGPIFMFHHANLDRSRLWWMLRHNEEDEVCTYYGFPLTDAAYIFNSIVEGGAAFDGAHLNDVVSSTWGFTPADLGIGEVSSDSTDGQVTHADILCYFNPESAPYTYDTNIDCLNDSSLCHDVQLLETTYEDSTGSSTTSPGSTDSSDTADSEEEDSEGDESAGNIVVPFQIAFLTILSLLVGFL